MLKDTTGPIPEGINFYSMGIFQFNAETKKLISIFDRGIYVGFADLTILYSQTEIPVIQI